MAKRKTNLLIRNTTKPIKAVNTGKRTIPFDKDGVIRIQDPGEAAEIKARLGSDVTLNAIERQTDTIHNYRFVAPGMPWHKYDELGRKIEEKTA